MEGEGRGGGERKSQREAREDGDCHAYRCNCDSMESEV
jgi:hypothetical protein